MAYEATYRRFEGFSDIKIGTYETVKDILDDFDLDFDLDYTQDLVNRNDGMTTVLYIYRDGDNLIEDPTHEILIDVLTGE